MIKIQNVSKYLALADEGLVPRMECPMDQGLLMSNQNDEEEVYLYCLSCSYKSFIGSGLYDEICKAIKEYI